MHMARTITATSPGRVHATAITVMPAAPAQPDYLARFQCEALSSSNHPSHIELNWRFRADF